MTPRVGMHTMEPTESANAVYRLARETGHSRFPVVPEGVDQVIGIVHVKHVVEVDPEDRERVTVGDIMVEPVVVPSSLELDPLLELLRDGRLQMAVVVDEFGEVDGVVTMEDLIEELKQDYTIVIVTHNMQQASRVSDRTAFFNIAGTGKPGKLIEYDDTTTMFSNPSVQATEDYVSGKFG